MKRKHLTISATVISGISAFGYIASYETIVLTAFAGAMGGALAMGFYALYKLI